VRAGGLTEEVTLLRRDTATSSTGSGAAIDQYVDVVTVWARVQPLRGGESWTAAQRFAEASTRFQIRYYSDALDATWRLLWRDVEYDVIEVLAGGRQLREYQDILASASPAENPV
jgi:SPP1 family predicted phage head-tail adaptor